MMWVCHGLSPNGAWPPISDHFHAEHDEILLFLVSVFWVPNSWDVWIWGWIKTRDFPCECEDEHQQQPAVLVNGAVLTHANLQHVYIIYIYTHTTTFLCRGYVYLDWDVYRYIYICIYVCVLRTWCHNNLWGSKHAATKTHHHSLELFYNWAKHWLFEPTGFQNISIVAVPLWANEVHGLLICRKGWP